MNRHDCFRARMPSPALVLTLSLAAICATPATGSEPAWKRALSGDISAPPVSLADRVYVQTSDRMVTCLSSDGDFLWSKPLPGKSTPYLSVTDGGLVVSVASPGIIVATNLDGSFLWRLRGTELPVASPVAGRDGRLFLVYRTRIACLSQAGLVKWTLPIDESATGFTSFTGSGDLLVVCSGGVALRVSPYGELLEKIALAAGVSALVPVPSGFLSGNDSGAVRSYDVRDGRASGTDSETVWEFRGPGRVASLSRAGSSVFALYADGTLVALNVTDGSVLWNLSTDVAVHGDAAAADATLSFDYGQLYAVTRAVVCAVDPAGRLLWTYALDSDRYVPALSDAGIAYTVDSNGLLRAWKVESRIKSGKTAQKREYYGILNGKSAGYGIPDGPDRRSALYFLDSVSEEIGAGTVGTDEVHFARKLDEILRGDTGFGPFEPQFDASERARAATLLGRLGSDEYRRSLLDEAASATDPTVATGLLLGLAACGPDTDGTALDAIDRLTGSFPADETVLRAACDALYAVIRFSSGEVSREGTRYLARFLGDGPTPALREYARNLLGKLLE